MDGTTDNTTQEKLIFIDSSDEINHFSYALSFYLSHLNAFHPMLLRVSIYNKKYVIDIYFCFLLHKRGCNFHCMYVKIITLVVDETELLHINKPLQIALIF